MKIKIYSYNLAVVSYWSETRPLTFRENYRLTVSENRVLRKIFGPKREEAEGDRTKLHNEVFHDL
jgi:hypothetical protein